MSMQMVLLPILAAVSLAPFETRPAEQDAGSTASEGVESNSFPTVNEVLQGRTFANKFERDVFFLREMHHQHAAHWSALLGANITVDDYLWAPDKLERFIEELGAAMAAANDIASSTNLAPITSDPSFYANTNAYRPGILRAAARALIAIGPNGRQALADSFSESHYRTAPDTLEELADVVGAAGVADAKLATALIATAFTFATTNGGTYPRCTEAAIRNLLRLPDGVAMVGGRFTAAEVFDNPGRFQAIVKGIAAARAIGLATNLLAMEQEVGAKLLALTNSPGAYKTDLQDLEAGLGRAVEQLQAVRGKDAK